MTSNKYANQVAPVPLAIEGASRPHESVDTGIQAEGDVAAFVRIVDFLKTRDRQRDSHQSLRALAARAYRKQRRRA